MSIDHYNKYISKYYLYKSETPAQDKLFQALNRSYRSEPANSSTTKSTNSKSSIKTIINNYSLSNSTIPIAIGYYCKNNESENCRWCIDDKIDPVKVAQEKLMDAIIRQGLRARNKKNLYRKSQKYKPRNNSY